MYSAQNQYLGGPTGPQGTGQPPYGQQPMFAQNTQQPQQQQQAQYGQQQSFLNAQQTGYPPHLQAQATGYPSALGQSAVTGQQYGQYGANQPAQFQQQPQQQQQQIQQQQQQQGPVQQSILQTFQQPQPTGAPAQMQAPQATGMTSAQMADSFRSSASRRRAPSKSTGNSKIPNIRLSFITASDQAKFEQLFKSAVGNGQAMSGDQAKELLLRSKLSGDDLAQIWTLADTTKSGQLLFPEFALAMYLCNLKLNGKTLPSTLPEKVKNEVGSMVDIISFGIPDEKPLPPIQTNVPDFFDSRQSNKSPPVIQQPQPQPTNTSLLASLATQPTGMMPQMTGYPHPMGMNVQPTGMMPQQTGYPSMPQATGYNGPRPPMPPMPTGYGSNMGPVAPLNAQPTGMPGQWGLVNTPATGLPNIDALHRQMMPQSGREGGFTTAGLAGNATIPWAVTKDEKKIYDDIFRAWDGFGKGFVSGDQAIEIFGQSGLEKSDLEKIWTLSDPTNRGRLNLDEFAVAMHLIYRKLNGYPVPNRLPPELTPPSTRNLNESIGTVKSLLQRDAEQRKTTGAFLQPQRTGVSYLKSHSFRQGSQPVTGRADGTVFKNNDDSIGYKSSARRRLGAGGRSPSPAIPGSPSSDNNDDISTEQLKKMIKEKQILLDAIDFRDEKDAEDDDALDRRDRRDADDLYRRIRHIQEDIDGHPNASKFVDGGSDAERRTLGRQLQTLNDRLPELASHVRRCERAIADAQLELFRLRDAKENPGSAPIVGTGPGGSVTEGDRVRARAKALMQQRSAALSGKPIKPNGDDPGASAQRLEAESSRIRTEREKNERMVEDVEESVSSFGKSLEDSLKEGAPNASAEHERRRWEDGLGVEEDVRDFIFELQRQSQSSISRRPEPSRPTPQEEVKKTPTSPVASSARSTPATSMPSTSTGTSYSSYRTAEERAAYIKQQAEQRMAERLAALGIKPTKVGETPQQRAERERKEQGERLRKAEEEDAQREIERQKRLADEGITPPTVGKQAKKPPPPPSRKTGSSATHVSSADTRAVEQELKAEQQAQELETKGLEEEEKRQEEELAREKAAADERLRALEEQVRQGKLRKEEEKKRRLAEQKVTKEKEARLAAQRAEIEAAKERERLLQQQLEGIDNDFSSDDDGPQEITPQGTTPTASQELSRGSPQPNIPIPPPLPNVKAASPPSPPKPAPVSTEPEQKIETKNPFFKKMQADAEANGSSVAPIPQPPPLPAESTNPFHRLTQQESKPTVAAVDPVATRAARARAKDDDDWSVVDSSDSEEDDGPVAGGAKHLASILFGTMGPPRPMSAMEDKSPASPKSSLPPTSPPPTATAPISSPPPPPTSGAPPPPPLPSGGPPAPPLPPPPGGAPVAKPAAAGRGDVGALLGAIRAGAGLKKVQTNDRSQSSLAGKVLQ